MPNLIRIHPASYEPIADLVTYRALPTDSIDYLDPFLFLNHHGPQVYKPGNQGLPFGPHPHRGMETVTFIIEGDIAHKDNSGHESVITAGGVQYMSAGRGLIHAETSSTGFKQQGGPLEILQLWLNLPAAKKMGEPFYIGKQKEEIPELLLDGGRVKMNLVFGEYEGQKGAFESALGVHLSTIFFHSGGQIYLDVPAGHTTFFYVIRGGLRADGHMVNAQHLAEFERDGGALAVSSQQNSVLLFGHAAPLNEPVVFGGPFVMNTEAEIRQAYDDYRKGKFGGWQ